MGQEVSFVTEVVLALAAVVNALVIFPVFSKLTKNERTNMASFQLNAEETLNDFKGLFLITLVFTASTSTIFLGNLLKDASIVSLGNMMSIASSFLPLIIFYRWWRRFR